VEFLPIKSEEIVQKEGFLLLKSKTVIL